MAAAAEYYVANATYEYRSPLALLSISVELKCDPQIM